MIGAPDVVFVHALDDKGRRIPKFVDQYVYFSFISSEGSNLEITFDTCKAAVADNTSDHSGSDEPVELEDGSILGSDDSYYKDMKKLFRLTDINESKYAASTFTGFAIGKCHSFNQPNLTSYNQSIVKLNHSQIRSQNRK